jgi:hypothetical protein
MVNGLDGAVGLHVCICKQPRRLHFEHKLERITQDAIRITQ